MIVSYIRSSSIGAYEFCNTRYLLEYVLGWKVDVSIKAHAGTIAHAVLEILAIRKKAKQDGENEIYHEMTGKLSTKYININHLIEQVYNFYTNKQNGLFKDYPWTDFLYKEIKNNVWSAITFNDGQFSPLKREIVQPEQQFDIELKQPWAKYKYELLDGTVVEGNLALKGTIDLIVKIDDETYEIIDWKTGKRINWATGEEKDYDKLKNDFQLRLYHYVVHLLYPHIKQIVVTIFFLKDGGPFTLVFDENDVKETERMIKNKFQEIVQDYQAKPNYTWKCKKLCPYSKLTFDNPDIVPLVAEQDMQFTKKDKVACMCDHVNQSVNDFGMDFVVHTLRNPGTSFDTYHAPGGGVKDGK